MPKVIYNIGGPCSVGKDTIVSAILERYPGLVMRFARVTSRDPRPGELPGRDYDFVSRGEFSSRHAAGQIVAVDDASANLYGIDLSRLQHHVLNGCPDRIVMVGGICGIKLKPHVDGLVNIYITAGLDEITRRLLARGHDPDDRERRLRWVRQQLADEPQHFDHVVENHEDRLDAALASVLRIMGL